MAALEINLRRAVKAGDLRVTMATLDGAENPRYELAKSDENGMTPLMWAACSQAADVEMVELLLQRGADLSQLTTGEYGGGRSALSLACSFGDPKKVACLIKAGAKVNQLDDAGGSALLSAMYGRDLRKDPHFFDLARLLAAHGADLNVQNKHDESPLRALAYGGYFDGIRLLLDLGADISRLGWNDLMRAVAIGSLQDVRSELERKPPLEERGWWDKTAWLLAVQSGDTMKTELLLAHGVDRSARGRCGQTALACAIQARQPQMVRWLVEHGMDIEEEDEFGDTALFAAVEYADIESLEILLSRGANVFPPNANTPLLFNAQDRHVTARLLAAGADPQELTHQGRRALLGFAPEPDELLAEISPEMFESQSRRRFGSQNPEEMPESVWLAMIRGGMNAYIAARQFGIESDFDKKPVWCAERFGQSVTFLPNGRIVLIAGEHEDSYDSDFCIYNDVFVREIDGTIRIFGYPKSIFPPTDFHTATLVGEGIYIIGNLGYHDERQIGTTPVYRLDTNSMRIDKIETKGECPGWIWKHRAQLTANGEILIQRGKIFNAPGAEDTELTSRHILDLSTREWRLAP